MKNLTEEQLLGEGMFAQVYNIQRKKDGLQCVAKIFKVPMSLMDSKDEKSCERELQILK